MRKNTKLVTIEMMIGLPASGKTTKANELAKGKSDTCVISIDDYKSLWGYSNKTQTEIIRKMVDHNSNNPAITNFIIDGLFLTNDVLIDGIIGAIQGLPPYLHDIQIKLKLHYWLEDRETCLKNDGGRRETSSSMTIQTAKYEEVDLERLNKEVGKYAEECELELIPVTKCITHYVQLKPGWERYIKPFVHIGKDEKLRSCKWCTGGTYGSCWSDVLSPASAEEPYEFTELDNLLEKICPTITFLQYKKIQQKCVSTEESREGDYYGGATYHLNWVCDLKELYNLLEEFGYLKD